ncbi:MAG: YfiR family protein [Flavobacteriales bacterium]|nr:YfiR family protein [Flavobacteriales bacterium]
MPRRTTWSRAVMLFVASVVLTASAPQRELEKDTSAILQASYIYNIAKLVEWKDPAMSSGTFIIGVIGGANLYQEMIKKYSTKSIGKQPIEVRKLPRSATVDRCHILFVGQSDIALMPEIYRNLAGKSTLIITEYPDALEDGSVANFVRTDNTLKYEMSVVNARKHKLEVALTLKQLALRVEE